MHAGVTSVRRILVHPKDPVPKQERASVVYHIPCNNCPQAYIGQTSRTLTQRLKEHQWAVHNGDLATSALAEHAHSPSHPIDWTEAHVIDTCTHTSRRCLRVLDDPEGAHPPQQRERNPSSCLQKPPAFFELLISKHFSPTPTFMNIHIIFFNFLSHH